MFTMKTNPGKNINMKTWKTQSLEYWPNNVGGQSRQNKKTYTTQVVIFKPITK